MAMALQTTTPVFISQAADPALPISAHPCLLQEFYGEQFDADSAAPLLAAIHALDCARVAAALAAVQVGG